MLLRSSLYIAPTLCLLLTLGCRSDETGSGGSGGNPSTGGGSNVGGNGGVGGNGVGGGVAGCEGPDATIQDITTAQVGIGAKVTTRGVVVMSHKFLVSKSSTTDNCLWGAFVSAPGLTETAENTGILILSYGTKASIPEGGTTAYCPRLGQDPIGDKIPDNVKPGDVLDVVGVISRFPDAPTCNAPNPPNSVGMLQLGQVCKADIVGTATPPTPKVLSGADVTSISSTSDKAFHDKWGGVKVRIENAAVEPQNGMVVGDFGIIKLQNGLDVGDKIYYRGYSNNVCHKGPVFTDPNMTFTRVDGFHYLAFCTWGLQTNDKCADTDPPSGDCTAATCTPDFFGQ